MLSGMQSSSVLTGWCMILHIRQTFNIWARPHGRSVADIAGGKGDLSDNLNAATPSCWKSDQDGLTISSMSKMYSTVVICLFWASDFFWGAHRFWLHCHISKKSWTLPILCNLLTSTSLFISESFSVFVVSNSGSVPDQIPLLASANSLTTSVSWRVLPVVFDCLQPITFPQREKVAFTPTLYGMIENMSRATLERSAYFECISTSWCHQSVMSGMQNVLLITIG